MGACVGWVCRYGVIRDLENKCLVGNLISILILIFFPSSFSSLFAPFGGLLFFFWLGEVSFFGTRRMFSY